MWKWNRLLRNRVSAQQARERKKAYLIDLETRVNDLEKKNSALEERLSTLQNENQMLRHVCHISVTISTSFCSSMSIMSHLAFDMIHALNSFLMASRPATIYHCFHNLCYKNCFSNVRGDSYAVYIIL